MNLLDQQYDDPEPSHFPPDSSPPPHQRNKSAEPERQDKGSESSFEIGDVVQKRARRKSRKLKQDITTEVSSAEFRATMVNYLENMIQAKLKKEQQKQALSSRLYAYEVVFGWHGLPKASKLRARFSGEKILESFQTQSGILSKHKKKKGGKRTSFADDDESESLDQAQEGRRVRPNLGADDLNEVGLGDITEDQDDNYDVGQMNVDDHNYLGEDVDIDTVGPISTWKWESVLTMLQGIEIGRRASSQADSNIMPWNISQHSRAGSIFSVGGVGTSSAIGIPSSVNRGFRSASRILPNNLFSPAIGTPRLPGLRVSTSPFTGVKRFDDEISNMDGDEPMNNDPRDEDGYMHQEDGYHAFEAGKGEFMKHRHHIRLAIYVLIFVFETTGQTETQQTDGSWVNKMMEQEGYNFLEYDNILYCADIKMP